MRDRFPPLFQTISIRHLSNLYWGFVLLIALWAGIGITMLYSAAGGNFDPWAQRQIIHLMIGFGVMMIIALSNPHFWLHWAYVFYGISLFLLILVEIMGDIGMGAQRWLEIGPLRIQPSELMKTALIMALARYYHTLNIEETQTLKYIFMPLGLILFPALLVVRQPDLGTAILLSLAGFMILFMAGVRMWKFVTMAAMMAAAIPLMWNFGLHDYQKKRIITFLDPEIDPLGQGYHITQSKIALGSGGFSGRGFLQGSQSQNNFLPEKHTDFIFTMLGEEFGLMGTYGILILFMLILLMGTYIALKSQSQFNRLIGFGMINNFALYVFINIAMVTGFAPVVGVPLPLISYGGSVVVSIMIGFGLILMVGLNHKTQFGRY